MFTSSRMIREPSPGHTGMTIPVSACALLKAWDESILTHGAGKDIKVLRLKLYEHLK